MSAVPISEATFLQQLQNCAPGSARVYLPQRNDIYLQFAYLLVSSCNVYRGSQISSKISIFVTTASFRHFVSFSSKKWILWSLFMSYQQCTRFHRANAVWLKVAS